METINGKIAIVTGGTRGIGLSIARSLLDKGAKVLICARNQGEIENTVTVLKRDFGDRIAGEVCNVQNYSDVQRAFSLVDQNFGGIDILVNNAGIGLFKNVEEMSIPEWEQIIATNLTGVFHFCHEAIPRMKKRGGGSIINIGSLAGREAFAGSAAYSATKFGIVGFSEALMQEVRFDHIKVSYVMPGSVNTSFGQKKENFADSNWKLLPEDVAIVVLNLLEMDARALPSRIELRPSEPKK